MNLRTRTTRQDRVVEATQLQGDGARIRTAANVAVIVIMATSSAGRAWRWQRRIVSRSARSNPYTSRTAMRAGVVSVLHPSQTRALRIHLRRLLVGRLRALHRRTTDIAWATRVSVCGALAILAAELLTSLNPVAGMILHGAVFCVLLVLAATSTTAPKVRFALGLSIAPLIRIVSLGIPASSFNQTAWYIVTAVPLFAASLAVVQATSMNRRDLNLCLPKPGYRIASVAVAASGLVIGSVEYMLLRPEAMSSEATRNHLILTIAMLIIATGFLEELIFRGILLGGAQGVMQQLPAILYTGGIFAMLHLGQLAVFHILFVLVVGVYFGVVVSRTLSLFAVAIAHGLANVMLFVVLPLRLG